MAGHQSERTDYLEQFEEEEGWQEIVREASPRNPGQEKVRVPWSHDPSSEWSPASSPGRLGRTPAIKAASVDDGFRQPLHAI